MIDIRAHRGLTSLLAALWLCSWLSVGLLHSHDSATPSTTHICLVCHFHHQSAPDAAEEITLARLLPESTIAHRVVATDEEFFANESRLPFSSRAPPL